MKDQFYIHAAVLSLIFPLVMLIDAVAILVIPPSVQSLQACIYLLVGLIFAEIPVTVITFIGKLKGVIY